MPIQYYTRTGTIFKQYRIAAVNDLARLGVCDFQGEKRPRVV